MPLFSHNAPPPPPVQSSPPTRSRSIFSRKRSPSPDSRPSASPTSSRSGNSGRGGFFSHRRSSSVDSNDLKHDPTIIAARQRVNDAQAAENAADRALLDARAAVRGAKDQVRILEQEAIAEARRAKAKQMEAKDVRRSAGRLGRHG